MLRTVQRQDLLQTHLWRWQYAWHVLGADGLRFHRLTLYRIGRLTSPALYHNRSRMAFDTAQRTPARARVLRYLLTAKKRCCLRRCKQVLWQEKVNQTLCDMLVTTA